MLLTRPGVNEDFENEIIKKQRSDEICSLTDNGLNEGKIVTLDNGKIKDVIFVPSEFDEDGFELIHHDYILSLLEKKHNLPKDSLLDLLSERIEDDENIKLGFAITIKDNALIFAYIHTNVNEVKDLILKHCPNIKNVYDDTQANTWKNNTQILNSI